jgi:hypothetical protein
MTGRVQSLRSNVAGNRPTGRQPGELYVNWPDSQLGVINSTGGAQDLIAITFYTTGASYAVGQYVVQGGLLYRCVVANAPGAFNPAQWAQIGGSVGVGDTAPTTPQPGTLWWDSVGGQLYVWYVDANSSQWVIANNAAALLASGYLALSGGTMTGPITLAADPAAALQPATQRYVDSTNMGFVNKLRNGTFDVWQRGATPATPAGTSTYTADGWRVGPIGAAAAVSQGGPRLNPPSGGPTRYTLGLVGAAGITALAIDQIIESYIGASLAGQTCTFQIWIANNTGATITPQLGIYVAGAADNWASPPPITVINNVNLQPCPNAAWTRCAYTFAMPAGAGYGVLPQLVFGAVVNANTKSISLSEADLRATPGIPIGLNNNPPSPELRPAGVELTFCQRYYQFLQSTLVTGYQAAGGQVYTCGTFQTAMRANPTVVFSGITYSNAGNLINGSVSPFNFYNAISIIATGQGYALHNVAFSAEQ